VARSRLVHARDDGIDDGEVCRRADSLVRQPVACTNDAANGRHVLERAHDRRADRDDSPSASFGFAHRNGSRSRDDVRLVER